MDWYLFGFVGLIFLSGGIFTNALFVALSIKKLEKGETPLWMKGIDKRKELYALKKHKEKYAHVD